MVGLLIGVCWGASDLALRWHCSRVLLVTGAICLLICAALTYHQVDMWHDDATLFEPLTLWD